MELEVRSQVKVWGRSMMSREWKEGKSPAEEEVWSPGDMWDGSGAATWSV